LAVVLGCLLQGPFGTRFDHGGECSWIVLPVIVHSDGRSHVPVRRPPVGRHLAAYGSTNKYSPVSRSRKSGGSGEEGTQAGGCCPCPKAKPTMLAMTAAVKAMDIQRWLCRTHLFQFIGTSSDYAPAPLPKLITGRAHGILARRSVSFPPIILSTLWTF